MEPNDELAEQADQSDQSDQADQADQAAALKYFPNIVNLTSHCWLVVDASLNDVVQNFVGRGYNIYMGNPQSDFVDPGFRMPIYETGLYE